MIFGTRILLFLTGILSVLLLFERTMFEGFWFVIGVQLDFAV